MDENSILLLCVLVGIIGILISTGVFLLGLWLFKINNLKYNKHCYGLIDILIHKNPSFFKNDITRPITEAYTDYLQRRNEFWTILGQTIIAILIVTILSILLITKSISAEAGLPILSGVSGFAIAKGISGTKSINIPNSNNKNDN